MPVLLDDRPLKRIPLLTDFGCYERFPNGKTSVPRCPYRRGGLWCLCIYSLL
ncbi:hypothetical protein FGIG_12648 [Fasciola gigantica]|uniref:Uncharacterized protein n=1 Tax=Fasciola gigantica TaxID=46835 RepID=A0A504YWG1_FASGI|nr:hypothetical protein FGIG_12648 [Fasciola gigantica]